MSAIPRTYLSSSTMNPCSLRHEWVWGERPAWMCTECGEVRPGTEGVDLYIQEKTPEDTPLNMVNGCGVGVIQTEFLELLFAELEGNLEDTIKVGQVFGPDDHAISGWRTFHGDPRVIVSGETGAGLRVCQECKRCHYFAQGTQYLCPAPLESKHVYYAGLGTLVTSERVRNQILKRDWRMLEIERLPILGEPLDGLPRDLTF